jgi:hypothetical protein
LEWEWECEGDTERRVVTEVEADGDRTKSAVPTDSLRSLAFCSFVRSRSLKLAISFLPSASNELIAALIAWEVCSSSVSSRNAEEGEKDVELDMGAEMARFFGLTGDVAGEVYADEAEG